MTGWRCDSNPEGVCFTEMVREPARQDIKTLGTRDCCTGCKTQFREKEADTSGWDSV
jgi:hypothetical protein